MVLFPPKCRATIWVDLKNRLLSKFLNLKFVDWTEGHCFGGIGDFWQDPAHLPDGLADV